jgi:hypothetical protein
MKKIFMTIIILISTIYPTKAHAFVVTATLAVIGGVLAGAGFVTPLVFVGTAGAVNAGVAIGAFLTSGFGSLLLSAGLSAVQYLVASRGGRGQQAPSIDAVRINVRVAEADRWLHIGPSRAGGAAVFAEFDADGNFWFLIVHGDSELTAIRQRYFDDKPIEVDENGWVTTDEFCLTSVGDPYEGVGVKVPYFRIYTTTFTSTDPTPPPIADFKAAFSEWTDDHKLVGTTYSVVYIKNISIQSRHKIYRWRGSIGLGEPALSIAGEWDRCFDPRDETQDIDDPSTWKFSDNVELMFARFRTHPYGRNKPLSSIDWDNVAIQANICDENVIGIAGTQKRYTAGISIPESKERYVAEAEILLSADAIIMHNSVGKVYAQVGYYEEPDLIFKRLPDIITMSSREASNGEMETDGVIVRYIDPDFNYQAQPSAPWINPIYYVEGTTPRYLKVDILACQNHNQAMRLAKAIGLRSQSEHRLAPTLGLRGLNARRKRIVRLEYDEAFTGNYEIATNVEIDENGITASFGCVPVNQDRWTLLEGEELEKPAPLVSVDGPGAPVLPTGVVVYTATVEGSGGAGVRIEATFDTSPRVDFLYIFEFELSGETDIWRPMTVRMDDNFAYSEAVPNGQTHRVRYWTRTISGRVSEKSTPVEILAVADTVAPDAPTNVSSTGGTGEATINWKTPNNSNYYATVIYRNTVNDINTSTIVDVVYGAANTSENYLDDSLSADDYYYWVVAINGSNIPSTPVATGLTTVT